MESDRTARDEAIASHQVQLQLSELTESRHRSGQEIDPERASLDLGQREFQAKDIAKAQPQQPRAFGRIGNAEQQDMPAQWLGSPKERDPLGERQPDWRGQHQAGFLFLRLDGVVQEVPA